MTGGTTVVGKSHRRSSTNMHVAAFTKGSKERGGTLTTTAHQTLVTGMNSGIRMFLGNSGRRIGVALSAVTRSGGITSCTKSGGRPEACS